jgi:hypothetical protein
MKTCIELNDLPFPVRVEQSASGKFRVTYGKEVHSGLSYEKAANRFGLCVFHALACADKLNNEAEGEA